MKILQIIYQDPSVLAIDKPSGMLVHRGWGDADLVLVDLVREHLGASTVHPIHRLDRGTSGVVLFACTPEAARTLGEDFARKAVSKRYLALVRGVPKWSEIRVDHPLPRREDGPRVESATRMRLAASVATEPRHLSWIIAEPETGRPHQIRRHLKHLNHPIIGDSKYGKNKLNRAFRESHGLVRMALHAERLELCHPDSGETMVFRAPLPASLVVPLQQMGFAPELLADIDSALTPGV